MSSSKPSSKSTKSVSLAESKASKQSLRELAIDRQINNAVEWWIDGNMDEADNSWRNVQRYHDMSDAQFISKYKEEGIDV